MKMRLPKTYLSWVLRMPENIEELVRKETDSEEYFQDTMRYVRKTIIERLEYFPFEEKQVFDGSKWKQIPCSFDSFDGKDIHLYVFVDQADHSFQRYEATIRMGQKIVMPYTVWLLDSRFDPLTLRLELEWPEQESYAYTLLEQAHRIVEERDWAQFVLEQCQEVAKGVGSYCMEHPGILVVELGRNYQPAEELYKKYEVSDFISHFVSELKEASDQFADVTSIKVRAEVYFESEPTEWEHIAYGISYSDYQKRTRLGYEKLEYDVIPRV